MASHNLPKPAPDSRTALPEISDVIEFWANAGPKKWFAKDDEFDALFKARFISAHIAASAGDLNEWRSSAEGVLALLVLLDQFPRNAFRESARMFATDSIALAITKDAVDSGKDAQVEAAMRQFIYMPLMHSESLEDQDLGVEVFGPLDANNLRFAILHRDIIVGSEDSRTAMQSLVETRRQRKSNFWQPGDLLADANSVF